MGYSAVPVERVKALASLTGLDLVLTFTTGRIKHAPKIEHMAHRILHPHRKSEGYWIECDTEWFKVSPEVAKRAVQEAIRLAASCRRLRELGINLGMWSWE